MRSDFFRNKEKSLLEKLDKCMEASLNRPSDENMFRLAEALDDVGKLYFDAENFKKADEFYSEALKIYEEIDDHCGTVNSARNVALSHERLGDVYQSSGNLFKAKALYIKGLNMIRDILDEYSDQSLMRDYAVSCCNLGDIYEAEEDLRMAERYYKEDLKVSQKLSEDHHDPDTVADLAISYKNMGNIERKRGRYIGALDWYIKAAELIEAVYRDMDDYLVFDDFAACFEGLEIISNELELAGDAEYWEEKKKNMLSASEYLRDFN